MTSASPAAEMDAIYRWQRSIYDVTRKYYLLGRDHLITELRPPAGGTILEVGCGTGRNLICAAERYPDAKLYGFDVSSLMLETAEAAIARAGLSSRITLAQADAAQFDPQAVFGCQNFNRVFMSYTLSMIPPWRQSLERAMAAVAPGGALSVVDFGDQHQLPAWFKAGLRTWLTRFSVTPRDDMAVELAALADRAGAKLAFTRPYRGYAVYGVVTRRPMTVKALEPSLVA